MKQRGLNELALEYLKPHGIQPAGGRTSSGDKIPYHRGVVLIEQSRQSADPAERSRLLDEAQAELQKFAGFNPQGVEAAEAQLQLGSMQLERGQQLVAQAKKLPGEPVYDNQRRTLSQEAPRSFRRSQRHI